MFLILSVSQVLEIKLGYGKAATTGSGKFQNGLAVLLYNSKCIELIWVFRTESIQCVFKVWL